MNNTNKEMNKHFDSYHYDSGIFSVTSGCFTMKLSLEQIATLAEWATEQARPMEDQVFLPEIKLGNTVYVVHVRADGTPLDVEKHLVVGNPIPDKAGVLVLSTLQYDRKDKALPSILFTDECGLTDPSYKSKTFKTREAANKYKDSLELVTLGNLEIGKEYHCVQNLNKRPILTKLKTLSKPKLEKSSMGKSYWVLKAQINEVVGYKYLTPRQLEFTKIFKTREAAERYIKFKGEVK